MLKMEILKYFLAFYCVRCNIFGMAEPVEKPQIFCYPDCTSQIYCNGTILHDVQMARIYPDSKTFVDKQLLYSEKEILIKYEKLKNSTESLTPEVLKKFVDENFVDEQLDRYDPPDFTKSPSVAKKVADENYRKWVLQLNEIWKDLVVKVPQSVKINPDRHSSIYLPHQFVKAGGRFREMYYWDSYWIIRGLLLCDMYQTAKSIILNMIWLVKIYGLVPNGSRVYYLRRSQPPMLIQMAATYYEQTRDAEFISNNIEYLEKEFNFWSGRIVSVHKDGKIHQLARYYTESCTPRPESYYEDFKLAEKVQKSETPELYTNVKSAAESGWDFSSRQIINTDGSNQGSLLLVKTKDILFVDLNSILHANAVKLSQMYEMLGNEEKSLKYKAIAKKLLVAIDAVFWNEEAGVWQDWDLINNKNRDYFYASNLTPLWTGSYYKEKLDVERVLNYLRRHKIIEGDTPLYYGIPTSTDRTSLQWDFPNSWAPLQAFVIQGLARTNHTAAQKVAFKMAEKWIQTTYAGYDNCGYMYEKYDAEHVGESGNGGEYAPQTGFGWTNGFCLEILDAWGMSLKSEHIPIQCNS